MATPQTTYRKPWLFVPTLYFGEGLPYVLVNTVSVILYKKMGVDNTDIAFWTSWLYLPWVIKMFWAPLLDLAWTKRGWLLTAQGVMALNIGFIAYAVGRADFFFPSLAAFMVGAFISATYDTATDGYYMLALTDKEQAFFAGLRSGFYRLAMIFGSGFLVYIAGAVETATGSISSGWMAVLGIGSGIFMIAVLYHYAVLPYPTTDRRSPAAGAAGGPRFKEVFAAYFRQEKIGVLVAFILFYRLGEAMLLKLVSPFLLDSPVDGGLGLATSEVGLVYGTVGVAALVLGGVLGGWLISRFGLRRCTWPLVITMHLPDLFFVYMAWAQPSLVMVYPLVALEQFGYGMGFTVFTVYLMYSAEGRYKTSHYAISTGIMAIGMMLPGFVSGWVQQRVGYPLFFVIVCLLTIPGMLTIPFLPDREKAAAK
ncbi:MAG: AmpG family muropeptide MFS transporter [Nitrospirae bacterium]|nr:AmpG family muropeptide MFS transporter [Nitrospirota bacterium]